MLYITTTVSSGTVIGRTVDAKIGATPERVTLLSEETLRIRLSHPIASPDACLTAWMSC